MQMHTALSHHPMQMVMDMQHTWQIYLWSVLTVTYVALEALAHARTLLPSAYGVGV